MEVAWRRWLGVRAAVGLTTAVALLSVATGIANIGTPTFWGPLSGLVPPAVQQAAGFTGTLTGFLMVLSAYGMRRGLRAAWRSTVVLLPVTALQGVVQASVYSVPLVALSVLALPVVVRTRSRFDREIDLTDTQIAGGSALVGVLGYGTVGAYALRDQFPKVNSVLDAFYFTLVTASTVGYGDLVPSTPEARLFTLTLVVLGPASFGVAIGALLAPFIESRFVSALGRMTSSQLELLEDHVVVLGYGDLTEPILTELDESDVTFVVVTPDPDQADALGNRGFRTVVGDPSDDDVLGRVHVESARAVVVATNDDAEDALSVLTARQLNADVRIVAAATHRENADKLRRAGADTVISPATIGGRLLVASAFGRQGVESLADDLLDAVDRE